MNGVCKGLIVVLIVVWSKLNRKKLVLLSDLFIERNATDTIIKSNKRTIRCRLLPVRFFSCHLDLLASFVFALETIECFRFGTQRLALVDELFHSVAGSQPLSVTTLLHPFTTLLLSF